jgi:hypothetical protein
MKLDLSEFQQEHVARSETKVLRTRFPVIVQSTARTSREIHHDSNVFAIHDRQHRLKPSPKFHLLSESRPSTDFARKKGGCEPLNKMIERFQKPYPDRFVTFTEPMWDQTGRPNYAKIQAEAIASAKMAGALGLKVLGLYLREELPKAEDR